MRKNLLALSIAAMVGGLSGVANAAVLITTADAAYKDPASATGEAYKGTPAEISKRIVLDYGIPALPAVKVGNEVKQVQRAQSLIVEPQGVGHILLVPYFTTQGKNKTLLSITNTDLVNGKAVKLRFRGAANSDDVFDITVFLSPGDMWTADVGSDDGIISNLSTTDTSCTLPTAQDIKDLGGKFKLVRVQGEDAKQTREGYVEILNTADVPVGSALFTATKHIAGKAPCTQAVMDLQETDLVVVPGINTSGGVNSPVSRGYSWPTGGLTANWIIVNTETMASSSGEAVAVRAIDAAGANAAGNIVWFPQTNLSLATGFAKDFTADPLLTSDGFKSQVANYDFPDLSTPYLVQPAATAAAWVNVLPSVQADNLAAAIATTSVTNDVMTGNGFTTDWVFSMPTRRYAVALDYNAGVATRLVFRKNTLGDGSFYLEQPAGVPLSGNAFFNPNNTRLNKEGTQACVTPNNQRAFDREETTRTTFVISPDTGLSFCGETSVLTFNNLGKASTLGALIARKDISTTFADGWFTVNTVTAGSPIGLPIVGFAAAKAAGTINLGGTWKQRTSK